MEAVYPSLLGCCFLSCLLGRIIDRFLVGFKLLSEPLLADLRERVDATTDLTGKPQGGVLRLPVNIRVVRLVIAPVVEARIQTAA
mmetsp:Transcript_20138/g.24841  ORF Transcript_20138/g.24841 Transcript_20138/m.24841 type:complete len:85 (+) Transcript_20138:45-299(+)